MPRYTRDEIIQQGLELSASATVIAHDMPGGLIDDNAYAIKWLQNALDMYHKRYPFSTDVTSIPMTINSNSVDAVVSGVSPVQYLPDNFMLDVRNGLIITVNNQSYRVYRKAFQYWLNVLNQYPVLSSSQSIQLVYTIINNRIKVAPPLASGIAATLWYYALPAVLSAGDFPSFPDEWVLIEFVRIKALEWTRSLDPGQAQAYMAKELARLRSTGLLNESEYDIIPLENNQVLIDSALINRNAWMGNIAI